MKENTVLTTQELAKYLKLNEKTVLKMVQSGELPGFKVGNQWRFYLSIVDEYLQDKIVRNVEYDFDKVLRTTDIMPLSRFIDEDCIELKLKSKNQVDVLKELSDLICAANIGSSKAEVFRQLKKREDLLNTVVAKGIAIPHSRNPRDDIFKKPGLIIGRSIDGIEYSSSSKDKVHLFFVPCSQDVVIHLKFLAKLANVVKDRENYFKFMSADTKEEVLAIFLEYEQTTLFKNKETIT